MQPNKKARCLADMLQHIADPMIAQGVLNRILLKYGEELLTEAEVAAAKNLAAAV